MVPTASRLAKNQFKCFHCRLVFAQRDGKWLNWASMQVHLCKPCEKLTKERPERA
jgi:hypothetical protein